jgi:hypothetical protein
MEEIPESRITTVDGWLPPDVEAVALECVKDMAAFDPPVIARRIARAILVERERCAKVAEAEFDPETKSVTYGQHQAGADIAAAIRSGARP